MNNEEKLKFLLRERELAQRKAPDPRIFSGPDNGGFWRKLLTRRPLSEAQALMEQWSQHLLDSFHPAPQTSDEQRISDRNRTVADIDADIAAIPPVTVDRHDHAPVDLPSLRGKAIVMRGLRKEPSAYADNPRFRNQYQIICRYHPATSQGLAAALGSVAANRQTELSIYKDGRRFPVRSRAAFSEEQNYDTAIRVDVNGRHYRQTLDLSAPMFAAVLECLPEPEGPSYSTYTRHVIYVPLDHDDVPRDLPVGDATPFIRPPDKRLTRILIAELSSYAKDAELVKVISLTESE